MFTPPVFIALVVAAFAVLVACLAMASAAAAHRRLNIQADVMRGLLDIAKMLEANNTQPHVHPPHSTRQ